MSLFDDSNATVTLASSLDVAPGAAFEIPVTLDVANAAEGWITGRLVVRDDSQTISNASVPISILVEEKVNAQVLTVSGTVTPGTASAIAVDVAGAPDTAVGASYNITITTPTDLTIDEGSVTQSVKNVTNTTLVGDAETGTVRWSGNLTELSGAITSSNFFATGLSLKNDFESAITNQLDCDDIAVNPSGCDDVLGHTP